MRKIQNELIPELEKIFRLEFKTPELAMLALSRPSIRNIYEDMEKHFKNQLDNPLKLVEYKELAASGDVAIFDKNIDKFDHIYKFYSFRQI